MTKQELEEGRAQLDQLRAILLRNERAEADRLRHIIDDPKELSKRITPIIEKEFLHFKETFPLEYEAVVHKLIDQRLKDSQDALLDVVYPMVGKMIVKFFNMKFSELREQIDRQVQSVNIFSKFFSRSKGAPTADVILSKLHTVTIEEVYVIQKNSGLLIGKVSGNKTVDADSIAGMLTAIKMFVEDAFKKEQQNLEVIQYETYEIFLQNFHTYTIAVAVSGSLSAAHKSTLRTKLFKLGEAINPMVKNPTSTTTQQVNKRIATVFLQTLQPDDGFVVKPKKQKNQ